MLTIILVSGGVAILILVAVITGRRVAVTRDGFEVGERSKDNGNPHSKCKHRVDLVQFITDRDDYQEAIYEITHRKLPAEIMNHGEDIIDRLTTMLESQYLRLLKEKGIASKSEVATTPQFKEYQVVLGLVRYHMVSEVRRMMRENGFIRKEETGQWENYVQQKMRDMIDYFTKLLNMYYYIDTPTRTEVYDYNQKLLAEHGHDSFMGQLEYGIRQLLVITKSWYKDVNELKQLMKAQSEELLK